MFLFLHFYQSILLLVFFYGPKAHICLGLQRLIFGPSLGPTRAHFSAHDLPQSRPTMDLTGPILARPKWLVLLSQAQQAWSRSRGIFLHQFTCNRPVAWFLSHAVSVRRGTFLASMHAATVPCHPHPRTPRRRPTPAFGPASSPLF